MLTYYEKKQLSKIYTEYIKSNPSLINDLFNIITWLSNTGLLDEYKVSELLNWDDKMSESLKIRIIKE